MASGRDEHRMVFDIRGRRKNVVKVVYAILAVLMAASLFLVVGPAPISELFGGDGNSTSSAAGQFEDQVERLQREVKQEPGNTDRLLALSRAQINMGNALATTNSETGAIEFTPEAVRALEEASESWEKYVKAVDEPSVGGAQLASQANFSLAQNSSNPAQFKSSLKAAAAAQEIVAKARPSIGSLSTLAIYRYYGLDFAGAEDARAQAKKFANTKFERENLENELDSVQKTAHEIEKQIVTIEKEAKKAGANGKALTNPLSESNPLAAP